MKTTEIYYFTGTGNSLSVARELNDRLSGSKLIPIASLNNKEYVKSSADVVGIIFPVYYGEAPNIVKDFVKKLETSKDVYTFAVATFGGSSGNSLKNLKQLIGSNGYQLSAGFGVHMPQNAFYKFWENKDKVYRRSRKKVDSIVKKINSRKKGIFRSDYLLRPLVFLLYGYFENKTIEHLEKISNIPYQSGMTLEELLPLADRNYRTDENCEGCGICAKVCPVNNIKMIDGKPEWQNHCENCLACYNMCPNKAIHGGVLSKDYHYIHPEFKMSDLKIQKGMKV